MYLFEFTDFHGSVIAKSFGHRTKSPQLVLSTVLSDLGCLISGLWSYLVAKTDSHQTVQGIPA